MNKVEMAATFLGFITLADVVSKNGMSENDLQRLLLELRSGGELPSNMLVEVESFIRRLWACV